MHKITRDDIQRIGDEDTLLLFLQEKLNLSISEEATLEQIALPLPLPFLGLDKSLAEQITDCRDLSGNPKNASGKRRPFLIRFRSKQNYPDILRDVAKSLNQKYADPADLFFICVTENFQPFAFTYFNDSPAKDWHISPLTILAWTQENTYIHTSYEHELSKIFVTHEPSAELDDVSEDDIDFEEEEVCSEKNVTPNEPETDTENAPLEKQEDASLDHTVNQTSSGDLLAKLENSGTPLVDFNKICEGVPIRCNEAFLINKPKYQQLIHEDAESSVLIKSQLQLNQRWRATSTRLIYIPNSDDESWHWSDSKSEVQAEEIFAKSYPAISRHLKKYRDELRTPNYKGKFYWELPSYKHCLELRKSKIVCPYANNSMQACYDESGAVVLEPAFFIPTERLSLLAILNSKLFDWYTRTEHQKKSKGPIEFKQSSIVNFPIAAETTTQEVVFSDLVQQILNDPDSHEVPDIEREIDKLVYKLYKLTPEEIALIEKGNNQ